ncbi:MAG: choice-of-anchor J domain-containing protein [Muribaculaceae bacterium]|nr:choice-of-anchor J domain-containing protein [Muribaculaceae bacterium]
MNKNIIKTLLVGAVAFGLTSCGENTWNKHFLDGFEGGVDYASSTQSGSYTLTSDDYELISSLLSDIATTTEEKNAAAAIKNNCRFDLSSVYPAAVAIPLFCETSYFPYYLANTNSNIDISYTECSEVPAEIAALSGAKKYKVSDNDYKTLWDSDENFINGFAPMKPVDKNLPDIIATGITDAAEGDYAIVTYNVAASNPVFTTVNGGDDADDNTPKVYLDETFADGQGSFTTDNVSLSEGITYVWKAGNYGDDHYMQASAYNKKSFASEAWLITPEISLPADANAAVAFEQVYKNFTSLDAAKSETGIAVREVGGAWQTLTPLTYPAIQDYNTWTNSGEISLAAYNGKKIQIGFRYTSTAANAGTWRVKNVLVKTASATAATASRSRALAVEVPTVTENAVYQYDGSKWVVATGVAILNPADYTAMGFSNNKLSDAAIYIPMYLKNKLPYAQSDDMEFVVYNNSTVNLFVYDGANWTLNDNALEDVTGRFTVKGGEWSFVKYVGKATYTLFDQDEIMLDRSYLLETSGVCAIPVKAGNDYDYLLTTSVTVKDNTIIMPTDANAFTFASKYIDANGKVYQCPEGKFVIRDSNNRYIYMKGTYSSFNMADAPQLSDGEIDVTSLFSAKRNPDGTWEITNTRENNIRSIYYSAGYKNFAAYTSGSVLPVLYLLNE